MLIALVCLGLNLVRNHAGPHERHLELGGEYFQIAVALAEGRGYADPFGAGTGATGWMPPGFTILLWGTNWLTGGEGREHVAAFVPALIALKCLCLGAGAGMLWSILRDWGVAGPRRAGFAVAWTVVVAWAQWEHVTAMMHDGWWTAFLVVLCLRGVVSLRRGRAPVSLAAGLVLAAFSSPVIFGATLGVLGWRALVMARASRRAAWRLGVRPALPALLLGLACFAGWSARVQVATGMWAPVKTNGGFELWQGLEHTLGGVPTHSTFELHPAVHAEARARYAEMGEKAYVEWHGREARRLIAAEPGRFVAQVWNRALNAFVAMERRRDTFQAGGAIPGRITEELMREKLLVRAPEPGRWRFLFLGAGDEERAGQLARVSPEAGEILRSAWAFHDQWEGERPWWSMLGLPELAVSGLATLAWAAALALAAPRLRRRVALAALMYLGVLGPYVLVSHYYRYQENVMGLQVIALAVAFALLAARAKAARAAG